MVFNYKLIIFSIVVFCFVLHSFPVYCDTDFDAEYKKQLIIEMELLKKMKSRFNSLSEPGDESGDISEIPGIDKESDKENTTGVFSQVEGLKIVRKLYEYGIYLYSVEANRVALKDVFEQLAVSNGLSVSFERIEPAFLKRRIDVSLENMPFQDVLEIVAGIFGIEFVLKDESRLTITIPSNIGIESPKEYFRSKIIKTYRKVQIKYPGNENVPETYYKLGEFFYSLGLKIIASQEYKVITERFPRHKLVKDSLMKLAGCYNDLGDFTKARDVYNAFIDRFPHDEGLVNIYWDLTDTYFKEGKYGIAISVYKKILEMFPQAEISAKVRERIVLAYMKNGEYTKAFNTLIALKKRRKLVKWDVEKDFLLGECLYHMNKYQDAFLVFANIKKNKELELEKKKKVHYRIAECLFKSNNCVEAIEMFKEWMQIYGNDAYGMVSVGLCLRELHLYDTGIAILQEALTSFANSEYGDKIKFELAMTYYDSAGFKSAIKYFEDILNNEESELFVESNFYMAESLFMEKKYNEAVLVYNKLLPLYEEKSLIAEDGKEDDKDQKKKKERHHYVENRIGTCYKNMGLFSKALDAYQTKEKQ